VNRIAPLLFAAMVATVGCSPGTPSFPDPPEGWLTDGSGSWWLPGADTSAAFRDLESFESMGMATESPVYSADRLAESVLAVGRFRMIQAVRDALLPLYRNQPEIVDSLFWRHAADDILPEPRDGDQGELFQEYRREAYRTLMRHFRAPAALTRLGVDIPVTVPDSLRRTASGRAVEFQVYLGPDGLPAGVRMLEGVHPVLDRLALRAVTRVEWQPAYVLRGNRSVPVEGWVRFAVRFPEIPEAG
jgi:hypothetical protein